MNSVADSMPGDGGSFPNIAPFGSKETDSLLSSKNIVQANADYDLSGIKPYVYGAVNFAGTARNGISGVAYGSALAAPSTAAVAVAGAATAVGLAATGAVNALAAACWMLPANIKDLKDANHDLQNTPPGFSRSAKKAAKVAKLGLLNTSLYLKMGLAQAASGVVGILGSKSFGFSPVLTGHAASVAGTVTGVFLGAVYLTRGFVMLARSYDNYQMVKTFREDFAKQGYSIDSAMNFMALAEARGTSYLNRRVNEGCLINKDDKLEYLKAVDKGIYTEELKHKISIVIALAMIIGGALAIAGSIVCPFSLPFMILLFISASFFTGMESIFFTYDSSTLFNWIRDRLYTQSDWISQLNVSEEI